MGRIFFLFLFLFLFQFQCFAGCSPSGTTISRNFSEANCASKNFNTSIICLGGYTSSGSSGWCSLCENSSQAGCRNCGGHENFTGFNCWHDCYSCTDQQALDSLVCVRNNEIWDSENRKCVPDTTYHCTSVTTENGVIRSQIDYIVHDSVKKQEYVLGSCIQNDFCEGGADRSFDPENNPTYAFDSCSYDSISTNNCKYVGQNGSACNYVCPDGRNWMCRMSVLSGINIPQCPSHPWKECADSYVPRKIDTPDNPMVIDSLPISIDTPPNFGNTIDGLNEISEQLSDMISYEKVRQYADEKKFDVIAGYGSWDGDGIWQNTKRIDENIGQVNSNLGQTNETLNNVVINQNTIIKRIQNDTIKVEVQNDSTKPVWVLPNWEPLVFAVDTNTEKLNTTLETIKNQVDTLVLDTPRTNSILSVIAEKFDSLSITNPLNYVTEYAQGIADSITNKLKPFLDNIVVDSVEADSLMGTFDLGTLPDVSLDTLSTDTLPFDTIPYDSSFFESVDSLVNFIDSLNQERLKQDTTIDTLPLDKMAGDSALIRETLSDIFLTDEVVESCFEFHMYPSVSFTIGKKTFQYDLTMVINFADLFGLDLCSFIRKIVQVLCFIVIVFTTIKGYIRAFGGSGIGG